MKQMRMAILVGFVGCVFLCLIACVRSVKVGEHFFYVPTSGFEDYPTQDYTGVERPLRFDGCYWRRVAAPSKRVEPPSTIVHYVRFFPNGSMIQGTIPKGDEPLLIGDAPIPTALDVDKLKNAFAGRYLYDEKHKTAKAITFTLAPSDWIFLEQSFLFKDESLFLIKSEGWQALGTEWQFLPLPGLKLEPVW